MWLVKAGFCQEDDDVVNPIFLGLPTTTASTKVHSVSLKQRSLFGEPCNKTLKCKGGSWLSCDPATSLCTCTKHDEMIWSGASSKCVVTVGESCKFGIVGAEGDQNGLFEIADCVQNAYCNATVEKGVCTCQSTHYPDDEGAKCSEKKGFGSSCVLKDECSDAKLISCGTNSTCECETPSTMILDPASGACQLKIGAPCRTHPLSRVSNAGCAYNFIERRTVCQCPTGYFEEVKGLKCAKVKAKGAFCLSDVECDAKERLSCVGHRCSCNPEIAEKNLSPFQTTLTNAHYQLTVDVGVCLAKVGQACSSQRSGGSSNSYTRFPLSDEIFCIQGAVCSVSLGSCICQDGKYETSQKLCAKGYSSPCSSSDLCSDMLICSHDGISSQKTCQCRNPDYQTYDSTVKQCRGKVGSSCNPKTKYPCVKNASCIAAESGHYFRCECDQGFVEGRDELCDIAHGRPCKQDSSIPKCDTLSGLRCLLDTDGVPSCRCRNEEDVYEPQLRKCSRGVGHSCKNSTVCVSGAVCSPPGPMIGSRCSCDNGRIIDLGAKFCRMRMKTITTYSRSTLLYNTVSFFTHCFTLEWLDSSKFLEITYTQLKSKLLRVQGLLHTYFNKLNLI